MIEIVTAAVVAGLVGSGHCVGMCGGFAAAAGRVPAGGGARERGGLVVLGARSGAVLWHLGRLTTYAILGAAAGAFGAVIPGPRWVPAVLSGLLLVWFAAALAGLTPGGSGSIPALARVGSWLARRDGLIWRYLLGVATGMLPCGLLYAALSLAVAAARPLVGAVAMVAFGLGTVPALALLSATVRRIMLRGVWPRRALALLVLVAGLGSLGMRLVRGGHMHPAVGQAPAAAPASGHGAHGMPGMR